MLRARWIRWAVPVLWLVALLFAFVISPDDVFLGASVRIFYIHVGMAWVTAVAFSVGLVAAIAYLVRQRPWMDHLAESSNLIGVVFTTAVLASGSIWAKVAWGVFWTWDPRLVTTAVMWFLYVAYFVIRAAVEDPPRRAKISAVYSIIAFLDLPLVFGSIHWWRTIHPVVITDVGVNISSPTMLAAMVLFVLAVTALYADLVWVLFKQARLGAEIQGLKDTAKARL